MATGTSGFFVLEEVLAGVVAAPAAEFAATTLSCTFAARVDPWMLEAGAVSPFSAAWPFGVWLFVALVSRSVCEPKRRPNTEDFFLVLSPMGRKAGDVSPTASGKNKQGKVGD